MVGLVRLGQRAQAEQIIAEVTKLGLFVDLSRQNWHSSDGRGGSIEPFICERADKGAGDGAVALTDDKIKVALTSTPPAADTPHTHSPLPPHPPSPTTAHPLPCQGRRRFASD